MDWPTAVATVPETVTFVRDPLPRNANGKVVKTELRRLVADGVPA